MFKKRFALPAIMLLFMVGLLLGALHIATIQHPLQGSVRPELHLTALSGTETRLPVPFFMRHIILLFTPSCPHCGIELDHFNRLAGIEDRVPIFGISLGDATQTDSIVHSMNVAFPVLLDRDGSVRRMLRIERVPVILFIDEDDRIRLTLVGSRSFQQDSMLYARFSQTGAPGAADVGSREGTDIRKFPDAPLAILYQNEVLFARSHSTRCGHRLAAEPSACLAAGMNSRTKPVGPRSSVGVCKPSDGPRQAVGSINHSFISFHEKEELSCVPRSQG